MDSLDDSGENHMKLREEGIAHPCLVLKEEDLLSGPC